MADSQSNARLRADAGVPTSGVIHVRTRLTADFTVIANALAQRRGSAVTVGVAAYISSLPDGFPVTISALCEHFSEGEILISRALRELEAAGYLERRRERMASGQIRTRTYFYDVPGRGGGGPDDPSGPSGPGGPGGPSEPGRPSGPTVSPELPESPRAQSGAQAMPRCQSSAQARDRGWDQDQDRDRALARELTVDEESTSAARPQEAAYDPGPEDSRTSVSVLSDADPEAVAVLTALHRVDPRLVLSAHEAARLAPAVSEWLAAGVGAREITELLTVRLPDRFRARPANVLAFRLRETPLPMPASPPLPVVAERPVVLPFQTCDRCERAFRAPGPGHCRDCRDRRDSRGEVGAEKLLTAG